MKTIRKVIAGKTFGDWRKAHAQLQRLQGAIDEVLRAHKIGDAGGGTCRVEGFSDGVLVLVAVSPAVAVHIRQILPTLRQRLGSGGYAVRECRVGVARGNH